MEEKGKDWQGGLNCTFPLFLISRRAAVNDPRWQFRKMSKGEMNVDPIEGEFF